jgi:hypothetical protein
VDLVPARYEIRVAGQLDEMAVKTFAGLDISTCDTVTIIAGEFDQAALHGVLERIRLLGLELLEARRVRGFPQRTSHAAGRRPRDQAYLRDQGSWPDWSGGA